MGYKRMLNVFRQFAGTAVSAWIAAGLTATVYLLGGLALLALGIWDIYADAFAQDDPLWTTLLENAATLVVGTAVATVGLWVTSRPRELAIQEIARWTGIIVAFVTVVTALILGTQMLQSAWKPWMIYANLVGALFLAGAATGTYASGLQNKAYYDPLTGLANRNFLVKQMQEIIKNANKSGSTFAILHVGLDNFKDVNDGFGRTAGDQLLQSVGRRLQDALSPRQRLGRLDGDEFVILAPDVDTEDSVRAAADKVKRVFTEPVHLDNQLVRIHGSVGIASYPKDAETPTELLRRVDAALRHAKRSGGSQWAVYRPDLIRQAANRVVVGGRLRKAMEDGEIRVAHQPIIRLDDEAVVGYEALARWYHPQEGWIPPDQFIPIAERNGLIEELSETVMRAACAEIARAGSAAGAPVFVSVNVSPVQIHRAEFLDTLKAICNDTGVAHKQLILEVTEQAILELDSATLARLQEIRAAGFAVAIDDFGTGYASLSYLKFLPADRLKLDREFVSDLDQDRGNQAIVTATLTLAQEFGLSQIAEGVETQAEADKLKTLGYTHAQGFFFGKPRVT